jgi:hypothetical protein
MPGASDRSRHDAGAEPEPSYEPAGRQTRDRRDEEQQEPEREERERADSVFGLIRRLLPRRQPPSRPYRFINFPQDGN